MEPVIPAAAGSGCSAPDLVFGRRDQAGPLHDRPELVRWEQADPGSRFDLVKGDRAENPRVAGVVPVVAHHEVMVGGNQLAVGIAVIGWPVRGTHPGVVLWKVRLLELAAIDEDPPAADPDPLAGQPDHPFDEVLRVVEGVLQDDDVASRWSREAKVD